MRNHEENQMVAMKPIKLTSTDNAISADMIVGLLEDKAIPCYVKDLATGNYMNIYMGYSVYGKEIYVDEADYEKAKELLARIKTDQSEPDEVVEIPYYKQKKFVARVVGVILLCPVVVAVILQLFF